MIISKGINLKRGQWFFGASIISVSVVLVTVVLFSSWANAGINFFNPTASQITGFAGPDQTVSEGSLVVLNAAKGIQQNENVSYSWTKIFGPSVDINGNDTAVATFTAPNVTGDIDLGFQVKIHASDNSTRTDEVVIHERDESDELPSFRDIVPGLILPTRTK